MELTALLWQFIWATLQLIFLIPSKYIISYQHESWNMKMVKGWTSNKKTDWMDIVTAIQGMERISFILNQIYRLIINSCGRSSVISQDARWTFTICTDPYISEWHWWSVHMVNIQLVYIHRWPTVCRFGSFVFECSLEKESMIKKAKQQQQQQNKTPTECLF